MYSPVISPGMVFVRNLVGRMEPFELLAGSGYLPLTGQSLGFKRC